jgi:undecaprenyl-diphosphatase
MKKETKKHFYTSALMLSAFTIWTVAVKLIDVKAIGPQESRVGFATINSFIHNLFGVHMSLYTIADWLSLIPIGFVAGFGILGLVQWIKRKKISQVDYDILILGGFYIVVIALYIFFETVVINYRPILINGYQEVSYPSSTTMLVLCVMPTAVMQLNNRIYNLKIRKTVGFLIEGFTAFMVIGRLISGVHWFSDIVGGILLSFGLVMMYRAFIGLKIK